METPQQTEVQTTRENKPTLQKFVFFFSFLNKNNHDNKV